MLRIFAPILKIFTRVSNSKAKYNFLNMKMSSHNFHDSHPNTYDRMASGATLNVARVFLPELTKRFPITKSSYILDNACGTGIVTSLIKSQAPFAKIKATDLAPGVLEVLKTKISENGWQDVEIGVQDVKSLTNLADNTFTHVITNFCIPIPSPEDPKAAEKATKEMWRVVKPGGVVVATTWKERNFTAAFDKAARRVRPDEEPFSWSPGPWDESEWLLELLQKAGFGDNVEVKLVNGKVEASSLEELVSNMMLFKDMFLKGYTDEEIASMPAILGEEIRSLESYEEAVGHVQIKMKAWVGTAWK